MPAYQPAGAVYKKVVRMYNAQNGTCGYCGTDKVYLRKEVSKKFHQSNRHLVATFEHIVPRSKGGTYKISNGICVCSRCNTLRSTLPLEEFFEKYEELYQKLIERPQRIAAKRELNLRKNGLIIARFAEQINRTVEELLTVYGYYDILEKQQGISQ